MTFKQSPPFSRLNLIETLQAAAERLGRNPCSYDCSSEELPISRNAFANHFGSFGAALDAAGLPRNPVGARRKP